MKAAYRRGFTIVELLIVIVVIAILAAITIVAYNGIQQRAKAAAAQSEVSQILKKIEAVKTLNGTDQYPTDAASLGLTGDSAAYYNDPINNTYCAQSKKSGVAYSITNLDTTPTLGDCTERGLLGWWQFNNSPNDNGPNGLNGAITGNVVSATGQDNQADHSYEFSSGATSYVNVAGSSSINDAQTFSVWVQPANWTTPIATTIFAKRSSGSGGLFLAYIITSNSLTFDCGASTGGNRYTPGYTPALNVWTHLVFTCSTKTGVAFYANGVPAGTLPSRPNVDRSSVSAVSLRFGYDTTAQTYAYSGRLDDVRMYNRVLTAGEIAALYANGAK